MPDQSQEFQEFSIKNMLPGLIAGAVLGPLISGAEKPSEILTSGLLGAILGGVVFDQYRQIPNYLRQEKRQQLASSAQLPLLALSTAGGVAGASTLPGLVSKLRNGETKQLQELVKQVRSMETFIMPGKSLAEQLDEIRKQQKILDMEYSRKRNEVQKMIDHALRVLRQQGKPATLDDVFNDPFFGSRLELKVEEMDRTLKQLAKLSKEEINIMSRLSQQGTTIPDEILKPLSDLYSGKVKPVSPGKFKYINTAGEQAEITIKELIDKINALPPESRVAVKQYFGKIKLPRRPKPSLLTRGAYGVGAGAAIYLLGTLALQAILNSMM
jgi:hypothetical protein